MWLISRYYGVFVTLLEDEKLYLDIKMEKKDDIIKFYNTLIKTFNSTSNTNEPRKSDE